MRMGAEVIHDFNSPKALSAAEDHRKGTFRDVRVVRGAASEL